MYYHRIDSLRCFAVLGVLFSHFFNQNITKHLFIGTAGVDLFFVISGFLITEILFRYKDSDNTVCNKLKLFYGRRLLRIFPIYYFYLFLVVFVFKVQDIKQVLSAVFYLFNFYEMNKDISPLLIHIWSLSIEEQFYLIWPFLILFIPQKNILKVIIFIIFFSLSAKILLPHVNHKLLTVSSFEAFGIGALFAYLKIYDTSTLKKYLRYKLPLIAAISTYGSIVLLSTYNITILDNWFRVSISIVSFYLLGVSVIPSGNGNQKINSLLDNKLFM
jgi:peptidoglycan/LPS O-acetylase OafA/YrhL